MKSEWRKLMRAKSDADPSFKSLAKPVFPRLLKELLQNCRPQDHLVAAFENSGLFPISVTKALARIPSALDSATVARLVDAALIKRLEIRRFGTGAKKPRGKKIPAGQSYTMDAEDSNEEEEVVDDPEEGTSTGTRRSRSGKKSSRKQLDSSKEDNSEEDGNEEDSNEEDGNEEDGNEKDGNKDSGNKDSGEELPDVDIVKQHLGDYVVAVYKDQWFLAEIHDDQRGVKRGYTKLSYMTLRGVNDFIWGPKDVHVTLNEDILLMPVSPEPINNRGHLKLKKQDLEKVLSLMVVVYLSSFISILISEKCSLKISLASF